MRPDTSDFYEGSKKVTCKEAAQLLREGKILRAWFRPDGLMSNPMKGNPDEDPAIVWFEEKGDKR